MNSTSVAKAFLRIIWPTFRNASGARCPILAGHLSLHRNTDVGRTIKFVMVPLKKNNVALLMTLFYSCQSGLTNYFTFADSTTKNSQLEKPFRNHTNRPIVGQINKENLVNPVWRLLLIPLNLCMVIYHGDNCCFVNITHITRCPVSRISSCRYCTHGSMSVIING